MKKIMLLAAAALFTFTGCMVKDEVYKGPTSIDKVVYTPDSPTSITPVTVTATVSGLQKVVTATLKYGNEATPMTPDNSGKQFKATIPAMPDGTEVKFTVTVVNEADFTTVSDNYSYTVGDPAPDWSKLKLNELYGAGQDNEKFIELHNGSDFAIKLTGVTLQKDEDLCWTGIDGEKVPAHGVFAIIGAKNSTERGISSGFSAKKSVIVELFAPDGTKLDTFQRGEKGDKWGATSLPNNTGSWSRIPDGTGAWKITETPTPGDLNGTEGTDDETVVQ